jgi:CDGSH iron-sulfur domain-containing protein 3
VIDFDRKIRYGWRMSNPEIPSKKPYPVDVVAGRTYYWCACGRSASQPFCDGAHKGSEFSPLAYKPETDGTVYFCGCKHGKNGPLCDGSHKSLG